MMMSCHCDAVAQRREHDGKLGEQQRDRSLRSKNTTFINIRVWLSPTASPCPDVLRVICPTIYMLRHHNSPPFVHIGKVIHVIFHNIHR